jgi:S1-C subfamily serine protease
VTDFVTGNPVANLTCHLLTSAGGEYGVSKWDSATAPKSDGAGRSVIDPSQAGDAVLECYGEAELVSPAHLPVRAPRGGRVSVRIQIVTFVGQDGGGGDAGFSLDWRAIVARVLEVRHGGPAAAAGPPRPGDVIVALDGKDVSLLAAGIEYLLYMRKPGENAQLGVRRGGETLVMTLTLGQGRD